MYRALLVCNSVFPEDPAVMPELNGARVDGLHLWRALTNPDTGMFSAEEIDFLQERTHTEIESEAERFFQRAQVDDVLLFYYSGHGRRTLSSQLFLCARDTTKDTLRSSGISCEKINQMMVESSARAIIVILDCCYSGGFVKGEDNLSDALEGQGIYVIAAADAVATTPDAKQPRQPSPFTAALATALVSETGEGDLDALFARLTRAIRHPRPTKNFDGSGTVRIAKRLKPREQPSPSARQKPAYDENGLPQGIHIMGDRNQLVFGGTQASKRSPRTRNDVSYGDLSSWAAYLICGIAQLIAALFCLVAIRGFYDDTGNWVDRSGTALLSATLGVAIGVPTVVAAAAQYFARRRAIRHADSRRLLLIELDARKTVRFTRGAQDIVAVLGALASVAFLAVTDGYDCIPLTILIGALLLPCAMTIIARAGWSDVVFLAGALLLLGEVCLPRTLSNDSFQTGSLATLFNVAFAVIMAVFWWYQFPPAALVAIIAATAAPILMAALTGFTVGPYLSTTGAATALLGVLLGAGVPVDDQIQHEHVGFTPALRRLAVGLFPFPGRVRPAVEADVSEEP